MKRIRTKIIFDIDEERLEMKINEFIAEHSEIKRIIDIKYAMANDETNLHFSALIIFTLKKNNSYLHLILHPTLQHN